MYTACYTSPVGTIRVTATDSGLRAVLFTDDEAPVSDHNASPAAAVALVDATIQQLDEYFHAGRRIFDLPLAPAGTPFQQQVWQELLKIPFGKTSTYSDIARQLDNPLSVRAVGTANGQNPIAIILPCHRVIGANGSLTGYAGGLWRKEFLLKLEGTGKYGQPTLW